MKETILIKDERFTVLHDSLNYCLVSTNSNALLKSGSLQDCMFYMEQLKNM